MEFIKMSEYLNPIGDDPADAVPAEPKGHNLNKQKDNGGDGQTQAIKSFAKLAEDLKASAAPAPDPLNRTGKASSKADPYDPDRYTESVDFTKLAATRP